MISVERLSAGYDDKKIIKDINFKANPGDFIGIVGPNGCGKTTMLKALLGLNKVFAGSVKYMNKDVHKMRKHDLARRFAFVPQFMTPIDGFSVEDMVLLGRTPYIKRFSFETEKDYRIANKAIEQLKIENLKDIPVTNLAGGEFQRVAIARAVAQNPKVMLLDEPISHLDLRFQMKILRLLRKLRENRIIIATFHNLTMAARFCRKVLLIKNGEMIDYGRPKDVFTFDNLKKAYRVNINVRKNPKSGKLRIQLP